MNYKMYLLFLIFSISLCQVYSKSTIPGVKKQKELCTNGSVVLRGVHKKKIIWTSHIDRAYQLSYYEYSHKLFFSYNVDEDDPDTFKMAYVKKDEHLPIEIDVENGFATAVDQKNRIVFFGGSKGIYKYHPDVIVDGVLDPKVKMIHPDVNVWDMFYKNGHLYYITYPRQRLYKYAVHENESKPERVKSIHEKIYQFAEDGKDDKFITNDTGLYRIKNGTDERIHYTGEKTFRAMAVDKGGNIHFAGKHGIFEMADKNHTLHEIARIKNLFGLTFDDQDNIVYSNHRQIIKILPHICD